MRYKTIDKPETKLPHIYFSKSLNSYVEIDKEGEIELGKGDLIPVMDFDIDSLINEQQALGYSTLKSYLTDVEESKKNKINIEKGLNIISLLNVRFKRFVSSLDNTEDSSKVLRFINKIYNEVKVELSIGELENARTILETIEIDAELESFIVNKQISFNQSLILQQIKSIVDLKI